MSMTHKVIWATHFRFRFESARQRLFNWGETIGPKSAVFWKPSVMKAEGLCFGIDLHAALSVTSLCCTITNSTMVDE